MPFGVRGFLGRHGIPALAQFMWAGSKNPGFSITFPTDGVAAEDTATALKTFLKAAYPAGRFITQTQNFPMSTAGIAAGKLVGINTPDEEIR